MPRRPVDEALRNSIKETLARRKAKNPAYSLRAFARFLEMSPSFLSEISSGRKGLSRARERALREKLGLPMPGATPVPPVAATPVELPPKTN